MAHRTLKVRFRLMRDGAYVPAYQSGGASGLDLHACDTEPSIMIPLYGCVVIGTGISIELPAFVEAQVRPRSSMSRQGLQVMLGTIDSDYRGEIKVNIWNFSNKPATIYRGDRIAQLIIAPVIRVELVEADELDNTERGANGFGSTGRR